jgi:hypothetical protein
MASAPGLWQRILINFPQEFGNGILPPGAINVEGASCHGAKGLHVDVQPDTRWGFYWIDCSGPAQDVAVIFPNFEPYILKRKPTDKRYPARVDIAASSLESTRKLPVASTDGTREVTLGKNWWKALDEQAGDLLAEALRRPELAGCGLVPPVTINDLFGKEPLQRREVKCTRIDLASWPYGAREALFRSGKCGNVQSDTANARTSTVCAPRTSGADNEEIQLGTVWKTITLGDLRNNTQSPLNLLTLSPDLAANGPDIKDGKYELQKVTLLDESGGTIICDPLKVVSAKDLSGWGPGTARSCPQARAGKLQLEWALAPGASGAASMMKKAYKQVVSLDSSAPLLRPSGSEVMPEEFVLKIDMKGAPAPDDTFLRIFESREACDREVTQPVKRQSGDERPRSANAQNTSLELKFGGTGVTAAANLTKGAAALHDGQQYVSKCGQVSVQNEQAMLSLDPEGSTQKSHMFLISASEGLRDRAGILRKGLRDWLGEKQKVMKAKPDSDVAAFRLVTIGASGTTDALLNGSGLARMDFEGKGETVYSKTEFNFAGNRQPIADLNVVLLNFGNTGIKRLLYVVDSQRTALTDATAQAQSGGLNTLLTQGVEISIMTLGAGRCEEWKKGWPAIKDCWEFPPEAKAVEPVLLKLKDRLDWLVRPAT